MSQSAAERKRKQRKIQKETGLTPRTVYFTKNEIVLLNECYKALRGSMFVANAGSGNKIRSIRAGRDDVTKEV